MIEIIIGILSCICLLSVVFLLNKGQNTTILMPILSILIGYLVGRKQEEIIGLFKKK